MSKRNRIILITAAAAAFLLIVAAVIMGMDYHADSAYSAAIAEAKQYEQDQDYYNAALRYQDAIDIKPDEEEGYVLIASLYKKAGSKDIALEYIRRGLEHNPGSPVLLEIRNEIDGNKTAVATKIDLDQLDSMSAHSFYDYGKISQVEEVKPAENNGINVRVKGIPATLTYRNTTEQPGAVEGSSPTPEAIPAEVSFDNIMSLFGGAQSVTFDQLRELGAEEIDIINDQQFGTAVTFKKTLYIFLIESTEDGTISADSRNIVTLPGKAVRAGNDVNVTGTVRSAVDPDYTVSDVRLVVRKAGGTSDDVFETVSDESGEFAAILGNGDYTVECEADGYVSETKSIYVPSGAEDWDFDIILSPDTGEARIVLTWGAVPMDLDSHLIGAGEHINFINLRGSSATLDVDDTDGYGPETTTIMDINNDYEFYVHNYSNEGSLADSGAEVTVYLPGREPVTISVGGGSGRVWEVFTLSGGELNIINEITDRDLGYD